MADTKQVQIIFEARDNSSKPIKDISNAVSDYDKNAREAKESTEKLKKELNETTDVADNYEKEFERINKEFKEYIKNSKLSLTELKKFRSDLIKQRDLATVTSGRFEEMSGSIKNVSTKITEFSDKGTKLTKVNGDMQSSTGLASAAVIEFGRGVSDAGFGITGVANNLQQLAAQLFELRKDTGSTRNAFLAFTKQLMGPLGILVAFQGLIALYEYLNRTTDIFGGKTKKATEELKKLNEELSKKQGVIENLRTFADLLETSEKGSTENQLALKKLKDEGYDPLKGSIEDFIKLKEEEMLLNIALDAFNQEQVKALTKEKELTDQLSAKKRELKAIDEADFEDKRTITGEAVTITAEEQAKEARSVVELEIAALETSLAITGVNVEAIRAKIKKQYEDFAQFLEDNSFKELILGEAEEIREELKAIESDIEPVGAMLFEAIDPSSQEGNLAGLKQQLSDTRDSAIRLHDFFVNQLNEAFKETKMIVDAIGTAFGVLEKVSLSYHENELARLKTEKENITTNTSLNKSQREAALADIEKQEREAQIKKIKAERDFFTIKQTLLIAEMVMEAKKTAQEAALMTLRMQMMGGAALATTKVEAAKNIAAGQMSIGSFMAALGPVGVAAFAVSIGSVIASIIKARKTAQQQISSLTGASDSGGVGGGAVAPPAEPDFNIVGASPTNQLAQTIATAEEQPVRAYVVSDDVTTAQQLDRNIIEGASLG